MSKDRLQRGLTQRILLLGTRDVDPLTCHDREYTVLGSKGDEYKVTVSNQLWCTCPDMSYRSKRCKHIFFVMARVLGVTDQATLDKETFSEEELLRIYANQPERTLSPRLPGSPEKENKEEVVNVTNIDDDDRWVRRRDFVGVDCSICFEPMEKDEGLVWCKTQCGNSVHSICHRRWKKAIKRNECVYCREDWKGVN